MDIGVKEIRKWHTDPKPKGQGWADIGYHRVIRRDGKAEYGRTITTVGSHVRGHNVNTIGICLVGGVDSNGKPENNFTTQQKGILKNLLLAYSWTLPNLEEVLGHRDFPGVAKACPSFEVKDYLKEYEIPI